MVQGTLSGHRTLRLRPGKYQALVEAEAEAWERELLQGAAEILSAQGFRLAGYARLADSVAGLSRARAVAFFEQVTGPAWAVVKSSDLPIPQRPFQINYVTCFTNGRLLYTSGATQQLLPGGVDYVVERQVGAADYSAVSAAHGKAETEMGRAAPAERIGLTALLFLGDKLMADQMDSRRIKPKLFR